MWIKFVVLGLFIDFRATGYVSPSFFLSSFSGDRIWRKSYGLLDAVAGVQ